MNKINGNYFNIQNIKLFYWVVGELQGASECLLYLSPFFEERMWVQRVAFNFAKNFNEATGRPVVILDYYGYGESGGDTEDFTLGGSQEHILNLINHLRINFNIACFSLWGLRSGCLLATLLTKQISQFDSMLLWAPILDLKEDIYRLLRSTVASQGTIFKKVRATRNEILNDLVMHGKCERDGYLLNQIDGYRIGRQFWQEISALEKLNDIGNSNLPTLIVDIISPKNANKVSDLPIFNTAGNNVKHERIITNTFWHENFDYSQSSKEVFDISINWFSHRV